MMRIDWANQAARQLDLAQDYIALSNGEQVSNSVIARILETVEQLAAFPMSGRPGRVLRTRELVISPFIVAYTVQKDRIVVLAIYHGAQRWPEGF